MLEDLIKRFTQRRDALNGQRHTLAEDIRMAASDTTNPDGHGWTRIRNREKKSSSKRKQEDTLPPSWVKLVFFFLRFCFPFVCVFVICS